MNSNQTTTTTTTTTTSVTSVKEKQQDQTKKEEEAMVVPVASSGGGRCPSPEYYGASTRGNYNTCCSGCGGEGRTSSSLCNVSHLIYSVCVYKDQFLLVNI